LRALDPQGHKRGDDKQILRERPDIAREHLKGYLADQKQALVSHSQHESDQDHKDVRSADGKEAARELDDRKAPKKGDLRQMCLDAVRGFAGGALTRDNPWQLVPPEVLNDPEFWVLATKDDVHALAQLVTCGMPDDPRDLEYHQGRYAVQVEPLKISDAKALLQIVEEEEPLAAHWRPLAGFVGWDDLAKHLTELPAAVRQNPRFWEGAVRLNWDALEHAPRTLISSQMRMDAIKQSPYAVQKIHKMGLEPTVHEFGLAADTYLSDWTNSDINFNPLAALPREHRTNDFYAGVFERNPTMCLAALSKMIAEDRTPDVWALAIEHTASHDHDFAHDADAATRLQDLLLRVPAGMWSTKLFRAGVQVFSKKPDHWENYVPNFRGLAAAAKAEEAAAEQERAGADRLDGKEHKARVPHGEAQSEAMPVDPAALAGPDQVEWPDGVRDNPRLLEWAEFQAQSVSRDVVLAAMGPGPVYSIPSNRGDWPDCKSRRS
jgi:hypothetical protein